MRRRERGAPDDAGFTLFEVIIAMSVFTVLVTAMLGILLRTTDLARTNNQRVVAANLATQQIEQARSLSALTIPDGGVTRTQAVGGTTYTVQQTANYLASDSATSVCSGSGNNLAYKLVTVTVTWPDMGTVKPVRADTLRALGLGADGLDPSTGAAAVAVLGGTGAPKPGIAVTLTPGNLTRTTGSDGCAVFVGLAPGTYTVSANTAGYAGPANTQLATVSSIGVSASTVARGTLLYDKEGTLTVSFGPPPSFALPASVPLMLRNTYLSDRSYPSCGSVATTQACTVAVPGAVQHLFPATYDVWTGTCADARQPTTVEVPAGGTAAATVGLGTARIDVQSLLGAPQPGKPVYAVHAAESVPPGGTGCASGVTHGLGSTDGSGRLDVALPYGTWVLTLDSAVTTGLGAASVTLTPAGGMQSATLRTSS